MDLVPCYVTPKENRSRMDEAPQLYRMMRLGMWNIANGRLQSHPQEAFFQDLRGRTPLHLALLKRAPLEIVTALLAANAKAVTLPDVDGRIPLHYSCIYGASVEVVNAIIGANNDVSAISHADNDGWNALHFVCHSNSTSIDTVRMLMARCPQLTLHRENFERTPLHFACMYGCSSAIVQELLEHHKEISTILDKRGRSPLHITCSRHDSSLEAVTVLQVLLDASTSTVLLPDSNGLNCLDILSTMFSQRKWDNIERSHPTELFFEIFWWKVTLLVKALYLKRREIEEEEKKKNEKGMNTSKATEEYPFSMLHETLKLSDCPYNLRQIALKKHFDNISVQDEEGNLPLHIAARSFLGNNNTEVVKIIDALLVAYPGATRVKNNEKREPLHLALQSGKTWKQGLSNIFHANPASIHGADLDLKLLPFILELVGSTARDVYLVLREMPDIM
mmetsp:Transcript_5768/g.8491  ORF Transcript_5768/g.8491 Transcript_5768/m.8491 type:complete len:449 (-) Transcript_5768:317-1663(-)